MHSTARGAPGGLTPTERLHASPVQSCTDVALILKLFRRNGEPNRRAVHDLIRSGAIAIIDPTQAIHRWTVASAEVERYVSSGPRKTREVTR